MVEEGEKLNKVKNEKNKKNKIKSNNNNKIRKDAKDVRQKELCKFYCKASIIIYSTYMYRHCFWFFILH